MPGEFFNNAGQSSKTTCSDDVAGFETATHGWRCFVDGVFDQQHPPHKRGSWCSELRPVPMRLRQKTHPFRLVRKIGSPNEKKSHARFGHGSDADSAGRSGVIVRYYQQRSRCRVLVFSETRNWCCTRHNRYADNSCAVPV
jgi:hypothetical protein